MKNEYIANFDDFDGNLKEDIKELEDKINNHHIKFVYMVPVTTIANQIIFYSCSSFQ